MASSEAVVLRMPSTSAAYVGQAHAQPDFGAWDDMSFLDSFPIADPTTTSSAAAAGQGGWGGGGDGGGAWGGGAGVGGVGNGANGFSDDIDLGFGTGGTGGFDVDGNWDPNGVDMFGGFFLRYRLDTGA